jgi:predicted enzyme related to lactoylglutathione lyase
MTETILRPGTFSWNELMTTDVEAAKRFYTQLFGWTTEDNPMPGMTYSVIRNGEAGIGGMMTLPQEATGMPPSWGAYVTVTDVDATAQQAQALGATILMPPTDIPHVGRFCTFRDPQGAVLSIITYG